MELRLIFSYRINLNSRILYYNQKHKTKGEMYTMWSIKIFKTKKEYNLWVNANSKRYQITEIFVNNAYGVEYRPLKVINV